MPRICSTANIFIQKVDLSDKSQLDIYEGAGGYWNDEAGEVKYQIGEGCEIDQLLAQWHADIVGLGDLFDAEQVRIALANMYKYNFKENMRSHYNTFRLFAVDDESGAIICDYPEGREKPAITDSVCAGDYARLRIRVRRTAYEPRLH